MVADPETQVAAAALTVSVGQLQDPPEVQGICLNVNRLGLIPGINLFLPLVPLSERV
jgi:hypothetical protein